MPARPRLWRGGGANVPLGQLRHVRTPGPRAGTVMGSQQSGELASCMRELDERGYTVVAGLLPRSEAEEAAEKLLALSVKPGPGGDSSMFGNLAPADWPIFQSMATHPVSLEMAEFALWARLQDDR